MRVEIEESGTIFANRYPADWPVHAWYPNAVLLPSGDLLCLCRLGAAMYSDDGRIVQFRSTDRGKTWQNEGVVRDGAGDKPPTWYAPAGLALVGGELILTGFRIHRPHPDMPTSNDTTGACLPEETFLMRSPDEGRTWTAPSLIAKPPGMYLEAYGSIIPLDGRGWLQVFDISKAYDDPRPAALRIVALISADRGGTWTGPVPVAGVAGGPKTFWHMRPVRCRDGCVVGFAWTGDSTGQNFLELHRIEGTADGSSWSEPEPSGIPGQTNCPVDLGGGRLALAYTRRGGDAPGIYVATSVDRGRTWDLDGQAQVWDAYGRESLGAPRTGTYPSSHDNIAFGAPNLIQLDERELLASFWAVVAGQTVCRWSRIRLVE